MTSPLSPDLRIIAADDEPSITDMLQKMILKRCGCQIRTCSDGTALLEALDEAPYDILLTDMEMPGIHGIELLQEIKRRWPGIAIIVVTAYGQDYPFVNLVRAGAEDFIQKPFNSDEIVAKIERIQRECSLRAALEKERSELIEKMERLEELQQSQRAAEELYHSLFDLSMNGTVILDPDGYRIKEANRAFVDWFSASKIGLIDTPWLDLFDEKERERVEAGFAYMAISGQGTLSAIRMQRPDDVDLCLDMSVTFISRNGQGSVLISCRDVTEQYEMREQLVAAAQTDELTGLFNRRVFHARLESAISRAQRLKNAMSLMSIDLDNFKRCNDTYGHQVGDKLLKSVGETIARQIRSGADLGFRLGGDEFAVIFTTADAEIAKRAAGRIRAEYNSGEQYGTSMSMGIAEYKEGLSLEEFVKLSDETLYQAKSEGKDTICIA